MTESADEVIFLPYVPPPFALEPMDVVIQREDLVSLHDDGVSEKPFVTLVVGGHVHPNGECQATITALIMDEDRLDQFIATLAEAKTMISNG